MSNWTSSSELYARRWQQRGKKKRKGVCVFKCVRTQILRSHHHTCINATTLAWCRRPVYTAMPTACKVWCAALTPPKNVKVEKKMLTCLTWLFLDLLPGAYNWCFIWNATPSFAELSRGYSGQSTKRVHATRGGAAAPWDSCRCAEGGLYFCTESCYCSINRRNRRARRKQRR